MTTAGWRRTGRNVARALLWVALLAALAIAASAVGVRVAGDPGGWQSWLDAHAGFLLLWRLLVYAVTVAGWLWMRRRLRAREPDTGAAQRLLRAELAAVLAIVVLEAGLLVRP